MKGLKCAGMPIGNLIFASVRSKVIGIEKDVHKLSIITDPKVHFDLLRFFQHTRLAFLARNLPLTSGGSKDDVIFITYLY